MTMSTNNDVDHCVSTFIIYTHLLHKTPFG